ncbi:uncharacterized protein LOC116935578 [Daphnia magna]|uniref:uncharacterized protein LOC116935578 n=1 Tax=Daphnia magna TaxID=35525 RepID=UPI001E1BBB3C|nr:uncharacterized protein LOC116935578 [Daphnia magna]
MLRNLILETPRKVLPKNVTILSGEVKAPSLLRTFHECLVADLETELAFGAVEESKLLPDSLHRRPDLNTTVAFDNFDLFVETLTGKDTLHDTVRIVTQDIPPDGDDFLPLTESEDEDDVTVGTGKRRRAFITRDVSIEPYYKKARMLYEPMLAITDRRRSIPAPGSLNTALDLDFIWMVLLCHSLPNTPMWTGWNSRIVKDVLPLQRVCYLPAIDASPTRADVVKKTMERSVRILKECNQKYISVTYDLAIAKQVLCIQSMEKPKFNNLFIQLGSFHIFLSFFKAVGKFIAESGAPYALTESGVLAA